MADQPSLEHLRMIERMIIRVEQSPGPAQRSAAVAWLMENVDGYLDNAVRCAGCQNAHLPVAEVGERLLCPPCYASAYVEGWESWWLAGR